MWEFFPCTACADAYHPLVILTICYSRARTPHRTGHRVLPWPGQGTVNLRSWGDTDCVVWTSSHSPDTGPYAGHNYLTRAFHLTHLPELWAIHWASLNQDKGIIIGPYLNKEEVMDTNYANERKQKLMKSDEVTEKEALFPFLIQEWDSKHYYLNVKTVR